MVSNPTVQYVIYEWLVARLAEWRRSTAIAGTPGLSTSVLSTVKQYTRSCHKYVQCCKTASLVEHVALSAVHPAGLLPARRGMRQAGHAFCLKHERVPLIQLET